MSNMVVYTASHYSTSVCSLYFCACSWQRILLYSSSWLCRTGILLSAISFSWVEENNVCIGKCVSLLKEPKEIALLEINK